MDNQFTEKVEKWLNSEHTSDADILEGATLMLQLTRNRILYNNILRKPSLYVDKIEYELKKHLKIRLDGMTLDDVQKMTTEVVPDARAIVAVTDSQVLEDKGVSTDDNPVIKGKRADHDSLPEEIQAKWTDNAELYKKIKKNFYLLLQLLDAPLCDRYEILKIQKELDVIYHANLEAYDNYKVDDEYADITAADDASTVAKKIQAARTFISRNIKILADLHDNSDDSEALNQKIEDITLKLSDKYKMMINAGATLAPETVKQLMDLRVITIADGE